MLSDEVVEKIAREHGTGGWQTLSDMGRFARAIESAVRADQQAEIDTLREQLAAAQAKMQHIAEYWNRDSNEQAMQDALWHTIEECERTDDSALQSALAKAREEMRERCAKVCDDNYWEDHRLFADAIRSLDTTPEVDIEKKG